MPSTIDNIVLCCFIIGGLGRGFYFVMNDVNAIGELINCEDMNPETSRLLPAVSS